MLGEWIDRWMDKWMNRWMDEQTNGFGIQTVYSPDDSMSSSGGEKSHFMKSE